MNKNKTIFLYCMNFIGISCIFNSISFMQSPLLAKIFALVGSIIMFVMLIYFIINMAKSKEPSLQRYDINITDSDEIQNEQTKYFDEIIKYAIEKGFNATLTTEMDETGLTRFWLTDIVKDGEQSQYKKLIELTILDESVTSDKKTFGLMIETTKEKLNAFIEENK